MKVLIITYYWPPSGGSGVQRWTFFAKYLSAFGITPVVLTVKPEDAVYPSIDDSLNKQVEGIEAHHTSGGFQLLKAYSVLKSGKSGKVVPVGTIGNGAPSAFDKLAMKVRANLFVPDARVGWNKHAINKALELTGKHSFDAIITTGPPHSTHLIGLELKKRTGISWIADFRDPWREVYYQNLFKRSARAERKDERLEQAVLQQADCVLTVGPGMRDLLASKIPQQVHKVQYVLNGFEDEMFGGIVKHSYPEFTVAHIGILTPQQSYAELLAGLRTVLEKYTDSTIRLLLIGKVSDEIVTSAKAIKRLNVDYRGSVKHAEAVQEMVNADLLANCLSQAGNTKLLISGKSMEYLASGSRVMILGDEDGDAATIFRPFEQVSVINPKNQEAISACIETAMNKRNEQPESAQIGEFSRKSQTGKLAEIIFDLKK